METRTTPLTERAPSSLEQQYEALPYLGVPYPATHPDRLATHAILFGLEPAPVETSRVLELGCGDGGNLFGMAVGLPDASFVGVDLVPSAIERGRNIAATLGLQNLSFQAGAIDDYQPPPGGFDYVIAHGFYSWVAGPVRDRLLEVCRTALADNGVAFVSYNALPGGHLRDALREMMLFHVAGIAEPAEQVRAAKSMLEKLLKSWPQEHEFGTAVRKRVEDILHRYESHLFHDELELVNEPVYFHEFVAHAARHGLQYLAEALFAEMQSQLLPAAMGTLLSSVDDPIRREQYLDFFRGRMFRQTLLCRAEKLVDRSPRAAAVERLAVFSRARARCEPGDVGSITFEEQHDSEVEGGVLLVRELPLFVSEALERLARSSPAALWVGELIPEGASDRDRAAFCDTLLRAYARGYVQLHANPPRIASRAGERPEASALARYQAGMGQGWLTSLLHTRVPVEDELMRQLLTLLDGTRDRPALLAELRPSLARAGKGTPGNLTAQLESRLRHLANSALLRR